MFEKGFQTKLFPEGKNVTISDALFQSLSTVIGCILLAMGVSAAVHRVCATTWLANYLTCSVINCSITPA